jgi:hypothetical protein
MKSVKFFAVSLLFATAARAEFCKGASDCQVSNLAEAFAQGAVAGAAAGVSVDLAKQYVLPLLPSFNFSTSLSNDELTGLSKASVAAIGSALLAKCSVKDASTLSAKLAGVIVGAIVGKYAQQFVSAKLAPTKAK